MVTVEPDTEITFVLLLVKATAPPGAVALSAKFPLGTKVCETGGLKVMVWAPLDTTKLAVALAPVKLPLAACVAVITTVPTPLTVTVLPLTVATFVLPLL